MADIHIHEITRIAVEAEQVGPRNQKAINVTRIRFFTADGRQSVVCAYSADVLAIEGSDHLAHVASGEKEPA